MLNGITIYHSQQKTDFLPKTCTFYFQNSFVTVHFLKSKSILKTRPDIYSIKKGIFMFSDSKFEDDNTISENEHKLYENEHKLYKNEHKFYENEHTIHEEWDNYKISLFLFLENYLQKITENAKSEMDKIRVLFKRNDMTNAYQKLKRLKRSNVEVNLLIFYIENCCLKNEITNKIEGRIDIERYYLSVASKNQIGVFNHSNQIVNSILMLENDTSKLIFTIELLEFISAKQYIKILHSISDFHLKIYLGMVFHKSNPNRITISILGLLYLKSNNLLIKAKIMSLILNFNDENAIRVLFNKIQSHEISIFGKLIFPLIGYEISNNSANFTGDGFWFIKNNISENNKLQNVTNNAPQNAIKQNMIKQNMIEIISGNSIFSQIVIKEYLKDFYRNRLRIINNSRYFIDLIKIRCDDQNFKQIPVFSSEENIIVNAPTDCKHFDVIQAVFENGTKIVFLNLSFKNALGNRLSIPKKDQNAELNGLVTQNSDFQFLSCDKSYLTFSNPKKFKVKIKNSKNEFFEEIIKVDLANLKELIFIIELDEGLFEEIDYTKLLIIER